MNSMLKVAQLLGCVALAIGVANCGLPEESDSPQLASAEPAVLGFTSSGQPDASEIDVSSYRIATVQSSLHTLANVPLPDTNLSCTNPDEDAWTNTGATKCMAGGSCTRERCAWVGNCRPKRTPVEAACPPPYCEPPEDPEPPCERKCWRDSIPHLEAEQRTYYWCADIDGVFSKHYVYRWITSGCC